MIAVTPLAALSMPKAVEVRAEISIQEMLGVTLEDAYGEANQEIIDICLMWFDQLRANEYHGAAEIIYRGLQKYPHSFALQTRLATVLGDYAGQLPAEEQKLMLQKSRQIFEKLHQEIHIQPKRDQFYFYNEYNYRFSHYKAQYENGVAMVDHYFPLGNMPSYGYKGYYFQGVGAANYAKQLLIEGDEVLAKEYARKSILAWAQYLSYCNNYYNAYVHYALALGILGEEEEMMRALQRGADLIHTGLDYYEFKEVIDFIKTRGA